MLVRLREGVRLRGRDWADLDQQVLESFLRALGSVSLEDPSRVALDLYRATRRYFFQYLARERRCAFAGDLANVADIQDAPLSSDPLGRPRDVPMETIVDRLLTFVGDKIPPSKLELVIETHFGRETLRAYVSKRRVPQEAPAEGFEILVERVKRERTRTLRRLRSVLRARLGLERAHLLRPVAIRSGNHETQTGEYVW
jgi:hypothetical protein